MEKFEAGCHILDLDAEIPACHKLMEQLTLALLLVRNRY